MMIHKGDKFRIHWKGHEECYKGRLYQVVSVKYDCRCSLPSWLTGLPEIPRQPHCHIAAKLIHSPLSLEDNGLHNFNDIDQETLHKLSDPNFSLEIVREPGDQLSLF